MKYFKILITLSLITLLTACGTVGESELKQGNLLSVDEYKQFYSEEKGFLFVSLKTDEKLNKQFTTINDALKTTNTTASAYATYIPDGENVVELNSYPENPLKEDLGGNTFSYIDNGKVLAQLDVSKMDGTVLKEELVEFIKKQK